MSSSDEDVEMFEGSPEVVLPARRGQRKRIQTPNSLLRVPNKKHRNKVCDDEDEEEIRDTCKGRGNTRLNNHQPRKRAFVSDSPSPLDSGSQVSEMSGISMSSEEVENRPPAPSNLAAKVDIPEDSSQPVQGDGQSRTRKRLSIRSSESTSDRTSSTVAESVFATASEVQTIYETCSQMFTSNKINAQNAFTLRMLDCINQMINAPTYDKSNMQLTSSTVEIGTKIYVCRVDNTHSHVLTIASEINLQQRRKKKDRKSGEGGGDAGPGAEEEEMDGQEDGYDDEMQQGARRKQKKRGAMKKRGRFVEEDNSKLLTGLEEQNVKFVTRRNILKKKFTEMIYEDLDFDYLSHFLEPEDVHPLLAPEEYQLMKSSLRIPEPYINSIEMERLIYLPFNYTAKFDPETQDVWGRSLNDVEQGRDALLSQGPTEFQVNPDFAYDPANRPAEYPEDLEQDHMDATFGDIGEEGQVAVSFHAVRSLDDLDVYFQHVKSLIKLNRAKFGWCGPNFIRPKTAWPVKQGPKKPKTKKEPERISFSNTDWSDKSNKYNAGNSARTVYDDRVIESWSSAKVIIPFMGIELSSYDDDFDPTNFEDENDPKYVPPIFKLFTNRNRSILDLLKERHRHRHASGESNEPPHLGDDGFDDVELPRDVAGDFCSQPGPDNDQVFSQAGPSAPTEDGWQYPMSLPDGLINDDPLSRVSDVDSIRFSRKPKPIDMSFLKKAILKTLVKRLDLDDNGTPLRTEETRIKLCDLMFLVLQVVDSRTEKLLSISIFIVALMHVIAERSLFIIYDDSDREEPVVICRGKDFNHFDLIPMPIECTW